MLIPFGIRVVTTDCESGQFFCGFCRGTRQYVRKVVSRHFTVFFIRIYHIDDVGQYVECQDCNKTFKPEAIHWNPIKQAQSDYHRSIKHVMLRALQLDGVFGEAEIEKVSRTFAKLTGEEFSEREIKDEYASIDDNSIGLEVSLANIANHLDANRKRTIVIAGLVAATINGPINQEKRDFFHHVAELLKISKERMSQLIEEFEPSLESDP